MNDSYYPFGMEMPARTFSSPLYRYGFNGKEKDDEAKGSGEQYDYGFRIYDPRVGRFLSVDPLSGRFPYYSPYQFSGNTPVQAIDLDGMEPKGYKWDNPYVASHPGSGVTPVTSEYDRTPLQGKVGSYSGIINAYAVQDIDNKTYLIYEDVHGLRQWAVEYDKNGWKGSVNEFKWNAPPDASRPLTYITVGAIVGVPGLLIYGGAVGDVLLAKKITDKAKDQTKTNEKPGVETDPIKPEYDYGKYGSNFKDHTEEIREDLGIPKEWEVKPSKEDEGIRFIDPKNPKANNVRVMPGRTNSEYSNSQEPYVVQYKNGSPVDASGNPIKSTTGSNQNKLAEIHVPLKNYKFN
ncbi:MAG: RHS repeat domain-containing protein [Flavisolibacter sp.]